ncbi:Fungal Zn2-Cys6 binuclear cluster domain-containing protein [Cladophialophora immunda]|nr:Fungal Zn2-Cys6 binuclear cluster domain-containing protein [Cladophialophora immunda]
MPRKTTGCWTCRARKKRCDDGRPCCSSCTLRAITCYGYDEKPQWMDGGEAEKTVMEGIKRQIKESYRRRRSRGSGIKSRHVRREIAPSTFDPSSPSSVWPQDKPTPSDNSTVPSHHQQGPNWGNPDRFSAYLVARIARTEPQSPNTSGPVSDRNQSVSASPSRDLSTRIPFDEEELNLVMYYLDHIFPRLSPYFKHYAGDTGRGWLLNLFLRTKPLCNAAVCLSACDKAQFVLGPLSDIPQPYHELEMQHLRSVADMRDHLDQLSKKTGASQMAAGVEALACIIHLIFFELWIPRKGLMSDWVMHLDAASALLSSLDVSPLPSEESPISETLEVSHPHEYEAQCKFPTEFLSEGEQLAFDFFLDFYIYCFINATASLGLTQQSAQSIRRVRALCHQNPARLWDRRGCEDWVLLTLLDIAILRDWKQKSSRAGTLSLRELNRRAEIIESRLHEGVAKFAGPFSPSTFAAVDEEKRMVTNIYVNGALVFLHVVVSGFYPNIPEIRQSVLRTLQALEYMREHSAINFPSWPYCVAGCLALESEYSRFRALVPPFEKGKHPLVLSKWTLEIIEECWKTRASQPEGEESCSWVTAMNHLGTRLLLL